MLYSDIGFGVAFANVCIILVLLSIYWQNYRKWKSQYTIGPPSPPPGPPMANPIDLPLLLINISQLVALATLLRISYK